MCAMLLLGGGDWRGVLVSVAQVPLELEAGGLNVAKHSKTRETRMMQKGESLRMLEQSVRTPLTWSLVCITCPVHYLIDQGPDDAGPPFRFRSSSLQFLDLIHQSLLLDASIPLMVEAHSLHFGPKQSSMPLSPYTQAASTPMSPILSPWCW